MTTPILESTDDTRRLLAVQIKSQALERPGLEARHGQVWNSTELAGDFVVLGFGAPFVVVRRKIDNRLGSLLFQHDPRYYFAFKEHKK